MQTIDMEERFITTVDPGTSSLKLSVARVSDGKTELLYYKQFPSEGIRYGIVFNPKKAAGVLSAAVADAESELGIKILQAVVVLPRFGVYQLAATGGIMRESRDGIEQEEVDSVRDNAIMSYPLENPDKEVIYGAQAQSFSTDNMVGLKEDDVVGMFSDKLEGNFKIFIGQRYASDTIDSMFNIAGIAIAKKLFLPCCGSCATLSESEKENGVALVEIGAGVSSVVIYRSGIIRHFSSIQIGSDSITNDIKSCFSQHKTLAENIKLAFGSCDPARLLTLEDKIIQINNDEDGSSEQIQVRELAEVIQARMKEILEAILYRIDESGQADHLRAGLVLSGGGANLRGLAAVARDMSGYSVRIGYPRCRALVTEGCEGLSETSAAPTVEAILAVKDDSHLNCSIMPEKEPEAEAEQPASQTEGDLGAMWDGQEQKVEPEKKQKAPKKEQVFWKRMKATVTGKVDNMESLFNNFQ